jgi:hypothetical protein
VFTPNQKILDRDGSFEITGADLHECLAHHFIQSEGASTEPAPPRPKFTFVTDDPPSSDPPPSSPEVLDDGATLHSSDSSYRHSETNDSSTEEDLADDISFSSDPADLMINMNDKYQFPPRRRLPPRAGR